MSESSRRLQHMKNAWGHLVQASKQRSRYFFHDMESEAAKGQGHTPRKILTTLRWLAEVLHLTTPLPEDHALYRARIANGLDTSNRNGFYAPPPEKADAGRMNPAGISYLYLAEEPETALLEVMTKPPVRIAVAQFRTRIEDIRLLDLCKPLSKRGVTLDDAESDAFELLREFQKTILQPVERNGREHVEYVPSQIVCEFFAHAHELPWSKNGQNSWSRLHGIRYPSVVYPQGSNIVLFPTGTSNDFRDLLEPVDTEPQVFDVDTWGDLARCTQLHTSNNETP